MSTDFAQQITNFATCFLVILPENFTERKCCCPFAFDFLLQSNENQSNDKIEIHSYSSKVSAYLVVSFHRRSLLANRLCKLNDLIKLHFRFHSTELLRNINDILSVITDDTKRVPRKRTPLRLRYLNDDSVACPSGIVS